MGEEGGEEGGAGVVGSGWPRVMGWSAWRRVFWVWVTPFWKSVLLRVGVMVRVVWMALMRWRLVRAVVSAGGRW